MILSPYDDPQTAAELAIMETPEFHVEVALFDIERAVDRLAEHPVIAARYADRILDLADALRSRGQAQRRAA